MMKIVMGENTTERSVFAIFSNRERVNLYISAFGPGGHVSCDPNFAFKTLFFFPSSGSHSVKGPFASKLGVLSF